MLSSDVKPLGCVLNAELKQEWETYREERHVQVLHDVCAPMQLAPDEETPGRKIVRELGQSLVRAMEAALAAGDREAARASKGPEAKALKEAYNEVEEQEDEHLYHSKGWLRELSLQALGIKAVLPPPEGCASRSTRC